MTAGTETPQPRERTVSPALVARVLDGLRLEADLDGVVTASDYRLAPSLGISPSAVDIAIHALIADGRVLLIGRHPGRGGTRVLQLADTG